jgi:hypothetical protein
MGRDTKATGLKTSNMAKAFKSAMELSTEAFGTTVS